MIYSNGAYTINGRILGSGKSAIIRGVIIKTIYPQVYNIGDNVSFPIYHNVTDKYPQFMLDVVRQREQKLKRILK